jgi:hypothetical protein
VVSRPAQAAPMAIGRHGTTLELGFRGSKNLACRSPPIGGGPMAVRWGHPYPHAYNAGEIVAVRSLLVGCHRADSQALCLRASR